VTSTGFTGALTGNATTATTLQNARTIQGVSFDGSANITVVTAGTGITVTGTAVAVDSTIATKTYVDTAVAGKDNTDEITEGSTNLYFTNARARGAVSAGTGISYNSTTGVISTSAIPNASLSNSSVTVGTTAISLGASSTTLAGLTSVTSTGFTGALTGNASTATTLQTARAIQGVSFDGSAAITVVTAGTGISVSGTAVTNTGLLSLNSLTGAKTLAHYHATFQTVTAGQETTNVSSGVTFTFADLSSSVHHMVLLNRVPLRPTEYSVSGTTLTIASGTGLAEGDEIEVTGSKLS
jgi:hypothetical protein